MGVHYPHQLYCNHAYTGQNDALCTAYAIRCQQCAFFDRVAQLISARTTVQTAWPVISEDYFEYVDVLAAADEYASLPEAERRKHPFVFIEGACACECVRATRDVLPQPFRCCAYPHTHVPATGVLTSDTTTTPHSWLRLRTLDVGSARGAAPPLS
eukprot:7082316-Prymnesium_polylepis.1